MKKRFGLVVCLVLFALMFTACGSSIELYVYSDGTDMVYDLCLLLENDEVSYLEGIAQQSGMRKTGDNPFSASVMTDAEWGSGNDPWKVEQYIRVLSALRNPDGFSYVKTDAAVVSGYRMMVFRKTVSADEESAMRNENLQEVSSNLFVRTYRVEYLNPFSEWRRAYDEALTRHDSGTFFEVFHHGLPELKMPSFLQAFPIANANAANFEVNYILETISRYGVEAPALHESDGVNHYYIYPQSFTVDAENIIFTIKRPNPTGWILVAILAGGAAVGIALWVAAYRKKHPRPAPPVAPARPTYPPNSPYGAYPYNPYQPYNQNPYHPNHPYHPGSPYYPYNQNPNMFGSQSLNPFEEYEKKKEPTDEGTGEN